MRSLRSKTAVGRDPPPALRSRGFRSRRSRRRTGLRPQDDPAGAALGRAAPLSPSARGPRSSTRSWTRSSDCCARSRAYPGAHPRAARRAGLRRRQDDPRRLPARAAPALSAAAAHLPAHELSARARCASSTCGSRAARSRSATARRGAATWSCAVCRTRASERERSCSPRRRPTCCTGSVLPGEAGRAAGDARVGPRRGTARRRRQADRALRRLLRPAAGSTGASSSRAIRESKGVGRAPAGLHRDELRAGTQRS